MNESLLEKISELEGTLSHLLELIDKLFIRCACGFPIYIKEIINNSLLLNERKTIQRLIDSNNALKEGLQQAKEGKVKDAEDFSQYIEDDKS